jgi:hypothetical protein
MYAKMEDAELVLRFFALRHAANYRHGMQGFLDLYMRKAERFTEDDVAVLEREFIDTLELAADIYGEQLFRPFDPDKNDWANKPQKAYYDAVMVGMSAFLPKATYVKAKAAEIRDATAQMFKENAGGTFTGRGNTKNDIETRIRLFSEMLKGKVG